ncbi:hypothetical protein [Streptomyces sp. NPDC001492]
MSGDMGNVARPRKRPRRLGRAQVSWPPALCTLKELLYEVYLAAGAPSLDEIAEGVAANDELPGSPGRDTVRRVISESAMPPSLADVVSVAAVLARSAAWEPEDLTGRVRSLWMAARMAQGAGRLISEYADDDRLVLEDLEVHHVMDVGGAQGQFGVLPAYVRREHDRRLEEVVAAAEGGHSGIAVLVGGSSTGKTRALWEAVRRLPVGWRLWHPLSPTRPEAALAGLGEIAPRTVVWLNEAQYYLSPGGLGEQVAAGLRGLLNDPSRAPVLVLATLWPEHWDTLTTRTDPDRHPHARELLKGHAIRVPDAFTSHDLVALSETADGDPRLTLAADRAADAQITQYLAGVPVLLSRYEMANGATQALIHAAMDARRLGAGPYLPLAWLADAALGYLTDTEYHALSDEWLTRTLNYVTTPCNGIPGILTPVKTSILVGRRNTRPNPVKPSDARTLGPHYLLADYLDQHGRRQRAETIPPTDFWTAASNHTHSTDLDTLGNSAWRLGLYRDAAQLHKHATTRGDAHAAATLVERFHQLHPTDPRPAQWAAAHAPLDDAYAVARLLEALKHAGAQDQVGTLLARDPATHVSLNNASAVARLLGRLWHAGAQEQLNSLATRAAAHMPLDDPFNLARLLEVFRGLTHAGAQDQTDTLTTRAAAHTPLNDPYTVFSVLALLREAGAQDQVNALLARDPATHVSLNAPYSVYLLLIAFEQEGAQDQVTTLLARGLTTHMPLDNPAHVADLLDFLRKAGAQDQVDILLARDPATHVSLDTPYTVAGLLEALGRAGAQDQVDALLARHPSTHAFLDNPRGVARLLEALREAGAQDQVDSLLARHPATHVSLNDPTGVAQLLEALRGAGAQDQAATLATAHRALDDGSEFAWLVRGSQEADAWLEEFRLGPELDRRPWSWDDLE